MAVVAGMVVDGARLRDRAAGLRAEGVPVRLHEPRSRSSGLDAALADACLAEGIPVETPPKAVQLVFWGTSSRRDLREDIHSRPSGELVDRVLPAPTGA